jgi:hypothetical protein
VLIPYYNGLTTRPVEVVALQHIRRMRGGAQSQLMLCSDGCNYVVKFQNNPQHPRVLVNDWLGTQLAALIGLRVPKVAIVQVDNQFIERSPALYLERGCRRILFAPGRCFGSRYVVSPLEGQVYDYLPEPMMIRVRNLPDFAGVLVFDKWTCNADGRQAVFCVRSRERKFTATFIDQGYCFNAGQWNFADAPLRGVFGRNDVYRSVTGWDSFEPWLSRIENLPESVVWSAAKDTPQEWYGDASEELEGLISQLLIRRARLRKLISDFKNSSRDPFPNWRETAKQVGPIQVRCHNATID